MQKQWNWLLVYIYNQVEPITDNELNKIVGEAKKQEEKKIIPMEPSKELLGFYTADKEQPKKPSIDEDLMAELEEIQIIAKKPVEENYKGKEMEMKSSAEITGTSGDAIEMTDKSFK